MTPPRARDFFFPPRALDDASQQALESQFFHAVRLPNGTYKTTYPNRMPDVDDALCGVLRRGDRVDLLDVGVSSGVTTLELLHALERHEITATATAVDIAIHAALVRRFGIDLLVDPQGNVLQIATPFGVKGRPHAPDQSILRGLLQRAIEAAESLAGGRAAAARGTPVQLVTPRLLRRREVRVVEHDLTRFEPAWAGAFDVVRAANIINRAYFDEPTLLEMLRHLHAYLRTGGLFCLTSTDDETRTNHATILRKTDDGAFVPEARLGDGSHVEALAIAASTPAGVPAR